MAWEIDHENDGMLVYEVGDYMDQFYDSSLEDEDKISEMEEKFDKLEEAVSRLLVVLADLKILGDICLWQDGEPSIWIKQRR